MMLFAVAPVFALALVEYVLAVSLPHQACNDLASQFPSQLFFPDSTRYVNESNSKSSPIRPFMIHFNL